MAEGEGRLVAQRYRLRRSLGRGGMGVVWLAHDEFLDREVAVKEIRPGGRELREDDPEVRRALREARAAAKLSKHPGIITIHDVVTDERRLPWIVMELLHGRSLSEALATDGPMSVDRAARLGATVLAALDYAHNNGVLHRDVKPANVMLVDDGDQAVLTDFGIAVIDGDSVLTATGQLPGVPEYISPERIRGDEALPAADLWSVGIMLYGMVVGRTPFHRGDVQATLGAVLSWEPDPDPKVGRLAPVIEGLLRKRPAERMTARTAIDRLTEIAALPAPVPPGMRVRLETMTRADNPAGEVTVADGTVPNTRTELPPFLPHQPVVSVPVRPDSPTLDPVTPRPLAPPRPGPPRRSRGPWVALGAVAAAAAIVVTVVVATRSDGDQLGGGSPTTSSAPATSIAPPRVQLEEKEENLGFTIDVPREWQRTASIDGPLANVTWTSEPGGDASVGRLSVRVQRDTDKQGVSADDFLAEEAGIQESKQDVTEYDQIELTGNTSTADLEQTYRSGGVYYRTRTRAVVAGPLYQVTFTLYANDARVLAAHWDAVTPLIDDIRKSFTLGS
ncbi:serine/threonine-protein kinase [Actinophytocola xinjiangensis]|uniref:serine/threonine-protein kinase n=1 Tax=Actinophytocola xinjiangensis TaxID=485602 RepID=UPI00138FF546|nr:serine/threonine-protein kinase [Actinophytocola xinjiangensis]